MGYLRLDVAIYFECGIGILPVVEDARYSTQAGSLYHVAVAG
jgi:hypothetical protein